MTHEAYEAWKKAHAERWVEQEDFFAGWEAARSTLTPSQAEPALTTLEVRTRHPASYVLLNEADGTRWRGTADGNWTAEPVTPSPVSREPEPVAWYDPTNRNPGQSVTFDRAKHEKWPHIYRQPLYPPLAHEGISEGRPEAIESARAAEAPRPVAFRQWSTKWHDWDYQTNRGDLRSDYPAEPLYTAIESAIRPSAEPKDKP